MRTGAELGLNVWNIKRMVGKSIPISDDTHLAGLKLREDSIRLSEVLRLKPRVSRVVSLEEDSKLFAESLYELVKPIMERKRLERMREQAKGAMATRGEIDRKACLLYKEGLSRRGVSKPIPLKELAEIEGIDVEPEQFPLRWIIRLGRWYVNRKYGKLDVSLNREKLVLAVVGSLCFVPISYYMYQLYAFKIVMDMASNLISMLLIAIGVILFSVVFGLEKLKCPNCSRNFGIRRTDSKRVERKVVYQTDTEIEIENIYRNTYACEFCGYKVSNFESVSETRNLR